MNFHRHKNVNQKFTIKDRARYLNQRTNYYARHRMLKNYESVFRLLFKKKNSYCLVGLYDTHNPGAPDRALYYAESRYFNLKKNLSGNYAFGLIVAKDLNKMIEDKKLPLNKTLALDLKNKKKINYGEFIRGLNQVLDPALKRAF